MGIMESGFDSGVKVLHATLDFPGRVRGRKCELCSEYSFKFAAAE